MFRAPRWRAYSDHVNPFRSDCKAALSGWLLGQSSNELILTRCRHPVSACSLLGHLRKKPNDPMRPNCPTFSNPLFYRRYAIPVVSTIRP